MGVAFADEIFTHRPDARLTIIDRRAKAGGHWNDAYPFVKLHQPAAFYGVNSLQLGSGGTDLSSRAELLCYFDKIMEKFSDSGRVEFLAQHNYLGNGQVANLLNTDETTMYRVNKRVVDASYMKVEVPATHPPKYEVDQDVMLVPPNELVDEYDHWEQFYVIGSGKTGMDAVLFLLAKGIAVDQIHWVSPNDAWLFNRAHIQVGQVSEVILNHAVAVRDAAKAEDVFVEMEKTGGILRIDENVLPAKWRCATVSPEELVQLRRVKNMIRKGRVNRVTKSEIQLQQGSVAYSNKPLFVDCTANGLAKREQTPIFAEGKITLQSILFCQQVFSAAAIARLSMTKMSDEKRNRLIPVPHPEFKEDWPSTLSTSISNLLLLHRYFPMWMFRSRLNFMSHEPMPKYFSRAIKAMFISPAVTKAASRLDSVPH